MYVHPFSRRHLRHRNDEMNFGVSLVSMQNEQAVEMLRPECGADSLLE
jgi:hypothetical protein